MTIEKTQQDGVTILTLGGRVDALYSGHLDKAFADAFAEGDRRFVWDCKGLTYISSAGLRSVLQAMKRLKAENGAFVLCNCPHPIMEMLEISGFQQLLTIKDDLASAIAAAK